MTATLRISGLSRTILRGGDEVDVVDGVDVELAGGEVLGVTGSLASGWRALLRLVAALDPKSAGAVALDGVVLPREEFRQEVVLASALDPLLDRDLDVVLKDMGRLAASRKRRVGRTSAQALRAAAGIGGAASVPTRAERLRLCLALASALSPAHLVLEVEPLLETDDERRALSDLIRRIAATGRGVLVGTRDELLLADVATRVLVMEDGEVLAEGDPKTVLSAAWKRVRGDRRP